jgi:hypothetical protein
MISKKDRYEMVLREISHSCLVEGISRDMAIRCFYDLVTAAHNALVHEDESNFDDIPV